jgi:hypothetical protein
MQEAFTVVRAGMKANRDKRAGSLKNPLARGRGSESGANVWAFTHALKVEEAHPGKWRRHEKERQPASTVEQRKTKQEGKGHE